MGTTNVERQAVDIELTRGGTYVKYNMIVVPSTCQHITRHPPL